MLIICNPPYNTLHTRSTVLFWIRIAKKISVKAKRQEENASRIGIELSKNSNRRNQMALEFFQNSQDILQEFNCCFYNMSIIKTEKKKKCHLGILFSFCRFFRKADSCKILQEFRSDKVSYLSHTGCLFVSKQPTRPSCISLCLYLARIYNLKGKEDYVFHPPLSYLLNSYMS